MEKAPGGSLLKIEGGEGGGGGMVVVDLKHNFIWRKMEQEEKRTFPEKQTAREKVQAPEME